MDTKTTLHLIKIPELRSFDTSLFLFNYKTLPPHISLIHVETKTNNSLYQLTFTGSSQRVHTNCNKSDIIFPSGCRASVRLMFAVEHSLKYNLKTHMII